MMIQLKSKLNQSQQSLSVGLQPQRQSLSGGLNIYTTRSIEGSLIEFSVVDGYLCWKRLGETQWVQLISLSSLVPQKGIDYFTEEDIEEILTNIPISSIRGLSDLVDSKAPVQELEQLSTSVSQIVQDKYYVHRQDIASDIWEIHHNMNKIPSVLVRDSAGNTVIGEINYIDTNSLTVKFNGAFSGRAYCN